MSELIETYGMPAVPVLARADMPEGSLRHLWNIVRSWMTDLKRIKSALPLVKSVPALPA